jgi:cytochrome oxidase Cu insertion factor (SCO1/SenC/PrrC family)
MGRAGSLAVLMALAIAQGPGMAGGHEVPGQDSVFIQGTFEPVYTPPAPGTYELPVIKHVPGFVLRDLTGRSVDTRALTNGKIAVVSFIYTACSDRLGCPLASVALRQLQRRLRSEGLGEQAILLSISFDPERDQPEHLASYAKRFDADPATWRFLTARSGRAIQTVLDAYGQDRTPVLDERGRFTGLYRHVLKVFLVDASGDIRNVYSAGFLVPDVIINDIKTLLAARREARRLR